jgi:hypothetical protein
MPEDQDIAIDRSRSSDWHGHGHRLEEAAIQAPDEEGAGLLAHLGALQLEPAYL